VVVAPRVLGERHVVLVHVDRHAQARADLLGDPDVVEVRVGEHERLDLLGPPAEPLQRFLEHLPRCGHAGVDEGQPVTVLEHVEVRVAVLEAVDAVHHVGVKGHAQGLPGAGPR